MKIYFLLIVTFIISIENQLFAQFFKGKVNRNVHQINKAHNLDSLISRRSSGTSGTGANIDVIYHKINWRINPDTSIGKYIKGSVQFNFRTTQPNVSTISFDIVSVLNIDSVKFRGVKLLPTSIIRISNVATITLTATLANDFIDSFVVFYQGVPPDVSGAAQGFQLNTTRTGAGAAGNVINSLSESYEDRDWWPCKHDMQDKIDSMDITVSVPWGRLGSTGTIKQVDTFWVATNGKMVDSTIINDSTRNFTFKTRYPIASYLVCLAVARYDRYYRTVNIGSTDVPVVYNLLKGGSTNSLAVIAMDKVNACLIEFSKRFGEYPFKNEKHGFYDGLDGASGMEHQTFSAMNTNSLTSVSTLIHETMHQWFGDNVTFAHWNDLWLAEGFAEYSDALSKELIPTIGSPATAYETRNNIKISALNLKSQSAWIPNINSSTSNLIWNSIYGSTIYQRGAMIISMLRTMCGDSIFFSTLTKYQTELAGKTATTDTLRNYFNRELGRDISVFFDDYVGGSDTSSFIKGGIGNPINMVNWNAPTTFGQSGKRLVIGMGAQTRSSESNVAYFRGPIQLHVKGALPANDTTITIFDWGSGNLSYAGKGISIPVAGNKLTFDLSFEPTTVLYDDSARTMTTGFTSKLATLEGYIWLGTTNTAWTTSTNWVDNILPPSGADVTIATTGSNHPILSSGNTTVGPLTIMPGKLLYLNGNTLTINNSVRNTGVISGSPTSNIIIADQAATLNFDQTNNASRSLNTLTINPKASATIGTGLLEIYGGLSLPTSSSLNVKSANLLMK
jgi:hypothetical protein